MTTAYLFLSLFARMAIRLPVLLSLGVSSLSTLLFFSDDTLASLVGKFAETMTRYHTAIPFFILAGVFMTTDEVTRRMINRHVVKKELS